MEVITIDALKNGLPTLTDVWGSFLVEACSYCLESEGHASGVPLHVKGDVGGVYGVVWESRINDQMVSSWKDESEATEYGATCMAILLIIKFTEYTTIERSVKGTGIDYWLGDKNEDEHLPFQKMGRLEVSGIKRGDDHIVRERINKKIKQITKSDETRLPAHIIVVEFSNPMANYTKR